VTGRSSNHADHIKEKALQIMRILGVIPARYASTRFPVKPLADIAGKSMIQRVYEQAKKSAELSEVVVATDHPEIFNHVKNFGGDVVMTKANHPSGTDRCFEALTLKDAEFNYVINIQGDEPFIKPEQINLLAALLDGEVFIATIVKRITDTESLTNPNVVKAVISQNNNALYFSRASVPYVRNEPVGEWLGKGLFYKHIGMYAYRVDVLEKLTKLEVSPLEKAESLEQLRWLDNGFTIKTVETTLEALGVDTPEDLKKAVAYALQNP
jgi:3-deoxy-manno-octulosonate cytidylyltransferase (CMP-KDO synthetase)